MSVVRTLAGCVMIATLTAGCSESTQCFLGDRGVDYAATLGCEGDFEALASRPLDGSIAAARSVKTLVDRADGNTLYFMNSDRYPRHYEFAAAVITDPKLPPIPDIALFNEVEYYSPERRFYLGAVTHYEDIDIWAYELAPYDTSSAHAIVTAFDSVAAESFFGADLYFHPTSAAQELVATELPGSVPIITSDELLGGSNFQPLNLGETYGQLRFFDNAAFVSAYVGPRDVAVFESVPNDIAVVAGLITAAVQTPLSHVNVLSQNRGTPNMALLDAFENAELRELEDSWVRLEVTAFDYLVESVTKAEADAWWEEHRPPPVQVPDLDVSVTELRDIVDLDFDDIPAFGAKASNFGVMSRLGEDVPTPQAFAIPVFYYKQFEEHNGFDVQIADLLANDRFVSDPAFRDQELARLRGEMRAAPVDAEFWASLSEKINSEYTGVRLRFRSSTNAEDLAGFSGAGLYSSASGTLDDADEPALDAIRKTWSSLWNFRAFEERSYNGIPHEAVAMAVLVHHSFPNEEINGVALTNNIFDETEPAFFINAQPLEYSVVSPEPGATADSLLYYYYHPGQPTTYFSYSSFTPEGTTVLNPSQLQALGRALAAVHTGFADAYGDPRGFYAMDVEFKFDDLDEGGEPRLFVKQARPHAGWAGE